MKDLILKLTNAEVEKLKKALNNYGEDKILMGQLVGEIEKQEKKPKIPQKEKVIYRPHRRNLTESLEEKQEFPNLKSMFAYIAQDEILEISERDIGIYYYCYDERIDWETYIVCYNDDEYKHPQAIGFCTFK